METVSIRSVEAVECLQRRDCSHGPSEHEKERNRVDISYIANSSISQS